MPKKLLIITGIYPPDTGGPAKFAEEFRCWLDNENVEVEVLTYSDSMTKDFPKFGIGISRIPRDLSLPRRTWKLVGRIGSLLDSNKEVLAIGAFIETYLASIIHRFSYVAKVPGDIVWERARNNRVTNSDIESFQSQPLNFKYKIYRTLYTNSLKRAKVVIVPSMGLYKLCIKWGISESKLRLIYNSVETSSDLVGKKTRKAYDLVTVCRLVPWKGVDELIAYVAARKLRLLVVGDGPERPQLQALANSLRADVIFEGDVSHQKVLELLLESSLFVLNSQYEGLPHALIEARVMGVLSVARAGTGSDEVINDDQDGFLVRPNRSLKETLDIAIQIQPEADSMIALAKEDSLKRFSQAANFPQILELLFRED